MMESALKELLNYGVLGIMVVLCIWYILRKDSTHKEVLDKHEKTILAIVDKHENERKEMNKSIEDMYQTLIRTTDANTRVTAELAEVIKNRIPR